MLYKRRVLKNSKFTDKHFFRSLLYNEVAGWKTETFRSSYWRCSVKQGVLKKVTLTSVFSCEFCELFKNNCFVEDLQTAGSETLDRSSGGCFSPERGFLFNKVASLTA